jgi:hypothetical protein
MLKSSIQKHENSDKHKCKLAEFRARTINVPSSSRNTEVNHNQGNPIDQTPNLNTEAWEGGYHSDLPIGIPDNASATGIDPPINDATWNPIDGLESPIHQIDKVDVTEHATWVDGLSSDSESHNDQSDSESNFSLSSYNSDNENDDEEWDATDQTNFENLTEDNLEDPQTTHRRRHRRKEESAWWPYGSKEVCLICLFFVKTESEKWTDNLSVL